MDIGFKLLLLAAPVTPILGAVARHYSPEWITDGYWVFSGIMLLICISFLVVFEIVKDSEDSE